MDEIDLLSRAGLATAIGLMIGIERGWQVRDAQDGSRVAGIRTFTCSVFGVVPLPLQSEHGVRRRPVPAQSGHS